MASVGLPARYRFGPFELQLDERRLLKDGVPVVLRSRAFDLLATLIERAGQLVTKDELLDRVWPGVVIEEGSIHVQISALRKVLGAHAIDTVSGQGYRFALPVLIGASDAVRHNLPYQLTSFIGREQEIAQLESLVTSNRLVTLTGSGGAGKTRLAIEAASRVVDRFADGVWRAELAALSDPLLVPATVAQSLGLREQPAKPAIETLGEYLAAKDALLVLDNAEHVLDACAGLLDLVLCRCPHVAALVTSRQRLGIAGELTYRVPSLTVPGTDETLTPQTVSRYEGVRLFVERARLVRPQFEVTTGNAASVGSISDRLDGIPLAIELAAPRLRSMSVEELGRRLDQRFALLTDGPRGALPRHRTLRSMIDWSHDLLSEVEQAMFRRLSVFAGGWTLDAAEHACRGDGIERGQVLELLTSLTDRSLILPGEIDGVTRYRMLETIRVYALDRLREAGGEPQWRNRHFAWIVALATRRSTGWSAPQSGLWTDRMSWELDNVRGALQWAIDNKLADAFRIAPNLGIWWVRRASLSEARQWFRRLFDAVPHDAALRDRARALSAVGTLAIHQDDFDEAERLLREADTICLKLGWRQGSAGVWTNLALVAIRRDQYAEAERLLVECLEFSRTLGNDHYVVPRLLNLALSVWEQGDFDRAASILEEAMAIAGRLGIAELTASVHAAKAALELRRGHLEFAEASIREVLVITRETKDPMDTIMGLERAATLAVARHAPTRAAITWGTIARLRGETGIPVAFRIDQTALTNARLALGEAAFDQAWREGQAMKVEEAVRYALETCGDAGRLSACPQLSEDAAAH
jgi:predicted ATPase